MDKKSLFKRAAILCCVLALAATVVFATSDYNGLIKAVNGDNEVSSQEETPAGSSVAAKIDSTEYNCLGDAIAKAEKGAEIDLVGDITEDVVIPAGTEVVLDLNGNTLTGETVPVTVEGNLTVKDSTATVEPVITEDHKAVTYESGKILGKNKTETVDGKEKTKKYKAVIVQNGGTFKLESGTIESEGNNGISVNGEYDSNLWEAAIASSATVSGGYVKANEFAVGVYGNGAVANIKGGYLQANDNAVVSGHGAHTATTNYAGTTINISGGTFIGNITSEGYAACGVYHPQDGKLNISGGEFYINNGIGVLMRGGQATISKDVKITTTGSTIGKVGDSEVTVPCSIVQIDRKCEFYDSANANVTISGGTFKSEVDNLQILYKDSEEETTGLFAVSGGTFSNAVNEKYCTEGYVSVKNSNTEYAVTTKDKVAASIGNVKYTSVKNAINDCGDEDTVVLQADTTEALSIAAGKKVTLNLNEKKIETSRVAISVYGDLTVNNGTVNAVSESTVKINSGGSLTSNNVSYYISNGNYTIETDNGAETLNLKNCSVINEKAKGFACVLNYAKSSEITNCNISGENLSSGAIRFVLPEGGKSTLDGNTIDNGEKEAALAMRYDCKGEVIVGDGNTIKSTIGVYCTTGAYALRIKGGVFSADKPITDYRNDAGKTASTVEISGGKFVNDSISGYLKAGCILGELTGEDPYKYQVYGQEGKEAYVMKDNAPVYYDTLEAAIDDAGDNTIYLLDNAKTSKLPKNLVGNKYKVTYSGSFKNVLDSKVNIKDVTLICTDDTISNLTLKDGKIVQCAYTENTLKDLVVENLADGSLHDEVDLSVGKESTFQAKIGNYGYEYISNAVSVAISNDSEKEQIKDKIVLLNDTIIGVEVNKAYVSFEIDLNGFTIDGSGANNVNRNGLQIIESGEGESKLTPSYADITVIDSSKDKTGEIKGYDYGVVVNGNAEGVKVTLDGVKVTSTTTGIYFPSNKGTLDLNNCTIEAQNALAIKGGTVNITGDKTKVNSTGNLLEPSEALTSGVNSTGDAIYIEGNYGYKINLNISAGTFTSANGKAVNVLFDTAENAKIAISGGTFSSKLDSSYCASGYEVVEKDSLYSVEKKVYAKIGETEYESLTAAIAEAKAGAEVDLVKNTTEDIVIPADKEIVLDLNGKTLTGKDAETNSPVVTVCGKLTVKDSTVKEAPVLNGNVVTYESGKIYAPNSRGVLAKDGGEFILESGSVVSECSGESAVRANGNYDATNWETKTINSKITINGGYVKSKSFGVTVTGHGAELNVTNGILFTETNAVVTGNGLVDKEYNGGGTTINISGGTLVGNIVAEEDAACGIYHPQKGEVKMTGGEIIVNNGVGILMRGGEATISEDASITTTGKRTGMVGDSKLTVPCSVVQIDRKCEYPDSANANVAISGGTFKSDVDNLQILYKEGEKETTGLFTLTGGTYSSKIPASYCKTGYEPITSGDAHSVGKSISITPKELTVEEGSIQVLAATVTKPTSTVTWETGNKEVATVTEKGAVKGIKAGKTTITATTTDGRTAEIEVTVTAKPETPVTPPVVEDIKDMTPVKVEVPVETNDEGEVVVSETITEEQETAITEAITAASEAATEDAPTYVEVTLPQKDGVAPAISKEVIEKAIESNAEVLQIVTEPVADDKESIAATFTLDISSNVSVNEAATAINTGIKAAVKEDEKEVVTENIPKEATTKEITLAHEGAFPVPVKITINVPEYNAGDEIYLYYINDGKLEQVGEKLTVSESENVTFELEHASAYVLSDQKQIIKATGITLDKTDASVQVGKTVALKATIAPEDVTDASVTWTSSDESVAKVDDKGVVTGIKVGTATITAKTANDITATCKVTVTEAPIETLAVPTSVKASVAGYNSVKITWSKVENATGYQVYRATSASGSYSKVGTVTGTSYTDKKLSSGKKYYYKVIATRDSITSSYSAVVSATPKLATPTSVKAASSSYNTIKISWKKVGEATKYEVYRATSKKGKYSKVATVTGTSYKNKKLKTGKTYYYKVRAVRSSYKSSFSSIVKASAKPATPSIKLKAGKKKVTISWGKVSGATGYEIYRATSKNGKYTKIKTIKSGKTVKYTNSKLKGNKKYYYKVRAVRKVSGKTYKGSFSSVKSVKAKK